MLNHFQFHSVMDPDPHWLWSAGSHKNRKNEDISVLKCWLKASARPSRRPRDKKA
jgi:hypothetical protein